MDELPGCERVRAGQLEQFFSPAAANVPAGHIAHTPADRANPATHPQLATLALPSGDVESGGHSWQEAAPCWAAKVPSRHQTHAPGPDPFLNFPAAQGTQGPPSGPVYPALQKHDELPGRELIFPKHCAHTVAPAAAYVPAAHIWQPPGWGGPA